MKNYAVLDTNVLVSALLKWDSVPGKVVQHAYALDFTSVFNDSILAEYKDVLSRQKFHFSEEVVDLMITRIQEIGVCVEKLTESTEKLPDPKDVVFYQVSLSNPEADKTFLVTGNIKHFPKTDFIITSRQMLDLVKYDSFQLY